MVNMNGRRTKVGRAVPCPPRLDAPNRRAEDCAPYPSIHLWSPESAGIFFFP